MPAKPRPAPATPPLQAHQLGREARTLQDDHLAVRTWLRLLSCSTQIEQAIRARLRSRFGTTLARFDYLAQLERHPEGLRMSALSRCLMVTGGNVTGLTAQLEADGLVARSADPEDGRSWRVGLTAQGRAQFKRMAAEHEGWLKAMFADTPVPDQQQLYSLLGALRATVAHGASASTGNASDDGGGNGGRTGNGTDVHTRAGTGTGTRTRSGKGKGGAV